MRFTQPPSNGWDRAWNLHSLGTVGMAELSPPPSCLYPIPRGAQLWAQQLCCSKGLQPRGALPGTKSSCPFSNQGSRWPGQQIQTPPNLGGLLGKAAWRRAGSLLEQQQQRTGRARQENPEFSPPRCFACLTASRALPVGFQPLPAPGAPQPARSPGRSREVLQEPSLPQCLPGGVPVQVCAPHSPQHGTGHVPAQSP